MELGLKGKSALVVGGTQGIGAEAARVLAGEGARVAVAARGKDGLDAMVAELSGRGAEAIGIVADMTRTPDAERAIGETMSAFGALDVLIVSIGNARGGTFWELDDATWQEALDLKFMGLVRVLRAAIPPMRSAGRGRVVAVVGNNGRQPNQLMLPGSASNAACLALIKGVADAVAADGISVNALNPGPTRTGRWHRLMTDLAAKAGSTAEAVEVEQLARLPTRRIGDPASMGRLAVLLASDLADWVTGTSLTADGGSTRTLA